MNNTKGRGGGRLNREDGLINFFPLKKEVGFLEGGGFFERWVGGLIEDLRCMFLQYDCCFYSQKYSIVQE